jgi:hypothetical protein
MLKLSAIFSCWVLVFTAGAQIDSAAIRNDLRAFGARTHISSSRQFVVHDAPDTGEKPIRLDNAKTPFTAHAGPDMAITLEELIKTRPGSQYARLGGSSLTMSCERIKQALLTELGEHDQWKGKIYLDLHHARSLGETILVEPTVYFDVWDYHVAMADVLDRTRVVSAMTELLLLEMANRGSGRSAEIPAWLTQGLAQEMIYSSDSELVLEKPDQTMSSDNVFQVNSKLDLSWRQADPLKVAHEELHDAPPLTFDELSWPKPGQLVGEAGEIYRGSAQFFVHELLLFKDGRECLRAMVRELGQHLNWQLAFRDAFGAHFANQLELEKWWALKVIEFTGRDLSQTWPSDVSWRKLDEIVHPVAEVRTKANSLPTRTSMNFQTIIREWDFGRQSDVLHERAQQLRLLRMRVSQDLIGLVDDYRRVLETYLGKRDSVGFNLAGRQDAFGPDKGVMAAVRQLNVLDNRREQMRPKMKVASSGIPKASVNP